MVQGRVVEVLFTKTSTEHTLNMVVANYDWGGGVTKQASLNIQSVKVAPVEATEEVVIPEVVVTATAVPEQQADTQAQEAQG